ncbi:MAG: hypothetical protein GF417_05495 [Candidatus Latescibacteria bacterium]|nr:hypothetical protein [bacterium]MBD3423869.1 hypothetical protein [Candidatus Latescibacterota bacterium]
MDNKIKMIILFLLVPAMALGSSCTTEKPFRKNTYVMGTMAAISIYGISEERADSIAGIAFHELHRLEQMMSTWNPDSDISRLNSSAGSLSAPLPRELLDLIEISKQFSSLTSGVFDITSRPLSRLWGFQEGSDSIPSAESIKRVGRRVGFEKISIQGSSVILPAGTEIDLAGIAKGYGVDRCADILRENGVRSALIDLGGNIFALGSPPGKRGWVVGIRNPVETDSIIGYMILRDEATASSGNYENYIERDGKKYGHIIDPREGEPVSGPIRGVTVIAPTATAADALSTSLFVLGPEEGISLCRSISLSNPPDSLPYIAETAREGYLRRTGNYADAVFVTLQNRIIEYHFTGVLEGKVFLEEE